MSRVVFSRSDQIDFFLKIKMQSKLSTAQLGKLVGISGRSFQDWMSGKTLPKHESVNKLCQLFSASTPEIIEVRPEHWTGKMYGRKAARTRLLMYGPPGTQEGRIKGGKNSQKLRRLNPDYYRSKGCIVANEFSAPLHSEKLAEFVGIVLGDGGITKTQLQVTLHALDDREYSQHVVQLIDSLFNYKASIVETKKNAIVVVASGVRLVQILEQIGLKTGNKVVHQVTIPSWITANAKFYTACVRGLFDTDGGTVYHVHEVSGRRYTHLNICFSNFSVPLLHSFQEKMKIEKVKSSINKHCVMIYNMQAIHRFFDKFAPNNPKHWRRYRDYL